MLDWSSCGLSHQHSDVIRLVFLSVSGGWSICSWDRSKSIRKKRYKKFREVLSFCSKCGGTMQVKIHSNVYPFSRWDIDQDFSKSHLVYNDVELLPRARRTALPPIESDIWVYWNESRNENWFAQRKVFCDKMTRKVELSRLPARHPTIKHFASLKASRRQLRLCETSFGLRQSQFHGQVRGRFLFGARFPVSPLELAEFCFLCFICPG